MIAHRHHRTKAMALAALLVLLLVLPGRADQPSPNISLAAIPAICNPFAVSVGQRLQKPGEERTTVNGTLSTITNGLTQTSAVQIVLEYPGKIRIDGAGPTIVFDQSQDNNSATLLPSVADMLGVLLDDSVDGLITISGQNGALRFLGGGYREQGAAITASSYNLMQMRFPDPLQKGKMTAKLYWFNGSTKLLAKVTYLSTTGASVEVTTGNWQTVQGDKLPFLLERRENGTLTLRLVVSSAVLGPAAQDGVFGGN